MGCCGACGWCFCSFGSVDKFGDDIAFSAAPASPAVCLLATGRRRLSKNFPNGVVGSGLLDALLLVFGKTELLITRSLCCGCPLVCGVVNVGLGSSFSCNDLLVGIALGLEIEFPVE